MIENQNLIKTKAIQCELGWPDIGLNSVRACLQQKRSHLLLLIINRIVRLDSGQRSLQRLISTDRSSAQGARQGAAIPATVTAVDPLFAQLGGHPVKRICR